MTVCNEADVQWIVRARAAIRYGEVVLIIHDGKIKRIDTKDRKTVTK